MIYRAEGRAGRAVYHGSGRLTLKPQDRELYLSRYYPGGEFFGYALGVSKGTLPYVLQ